MSVYTSCISQSYHKERLHVNRIFLKKSEVGRNKRMLPILKKWSETGHDKGVP